MVKRFKVIAAGLMAASCLVAAGPAAAQCYPGLACPPSVEPPPPPENTKPLTQEDKTAIQSGKRSYWTHNGSVVYLTAEGAKRSFFYHVPRPGVRDAGAKPGALLFEGKREGQSYSGTAYVFAGRWVRAITCAMVKVLPEPVTPSSTWSRSWASAPFTSSSMAVGWSPRGSNCETSWKRMPPSDFSGRSGRCGMKIGMAPETIGWFAMVGSRAVLAGPI